MLVSVLLRLVRAGVFAALCVVLAATAHVLSMAVVPAWWAQAVGFAVVFAVGYSASSRERSLWAIGSVMGLVQAGLHLFFGLTVPHPRSGAMAGMSAMGAMHGMDMHGIMMAGHPHSMMSGHALAAHALAALAASWWLRRGEAAVFSLLRDAALLTSARMTFLPAPALPHVEQQRVPLPGTVVGNGLRWLLLLRHAVTRRGPPPGGTAIAGA